MTDKRKTIIDLIAERCAHGPISFRDYIEIALYSEEFGYYTRDRARVGRSADRDFYTAESLGKVFAKLVTTAAEDLLPKESAPNYTFVEIAAEPGRALLDLAESHSFKDAKVIRFGDPVEVDSSAIIFANEWLDALPFHRLIYHERKWRERGVYSKNGELSEVLLDRVSPEVEAIMDRLPKNFEEGYQLDLPLTAEKAIRDLIAQDWHGLILLFDYGKTWDALIADTPNGTARTYFKHEQGQDLLEHPGEQDITCDICWTPLLEQLSEDGFEDATLESQESFLVKRAARGAEAIISSSAGVFSHDRQTLMELIHPANMGQRFQVLWGLRKPQSN